MKKRQNIEEKKIEDSEENERVSLLKEVAEKGSDLTKSSSELENSV